MSSKDERKWPQTTAITLHEHLYLYSYVVRVTLRTVYDNIVDLVMWP
jgi:hypothetical protein